MTQNSWRILIVDDEPNNLELMGQILKGQYKLSVAINGHKALDSLREASRDTIQRLVKAAEYKDSDTGIHVLRMSDYCAAIARHMGKTPEEAETFRVASTLHDIGKIGIPDRILLKPDKLTPEEWEIMKSHTTIGGKILGGSNVEFIRLCATIADVFDALTTRRPYKEPFSLERSFDILRRDRGTHFDPDVVDAFFDIESQILDIRENYNRQEALGDPEVMPARYAFND